ncbi:MAG: OmpA-like domain-containing protein [Lachnoclostridium sp.]|jgi:chemotaxis protein MotB
MARKKAQEDPSAGTPWLNTFADLMNLLLCFFVVLFAFSTVDETKYKEFVESMSSSIGIYNNTEAGKKEGRLINTGINVIKQYTNQVNEKSTKQGKTNESIDESEAMEVLMEENKKASQEIYDNVSEMADKKNLSKYIELSMDPNYQYVQISLRGSILFDSGKADIKPEALKIFDKLGDILQVYKDYNIEIEGHTDNVPVKSNSVYKDNNWLSSARAINVAMYLIEEKGLNPKTLSWTGRGEYDPVASNDTAAGRAKNRRVEIKIHNNINN